MFNVNTFKLIILIWVFVEVRKIDSLSDKHFACKNGKYIFDQHFCDRDNDCGDFSDETSGNSGCQRYLCSRGMFKCDGTCKNITVHCNTKPDCLDGSDESNCGEEIKLDDCTWQKGKFLCEDNLRCIYLNNTCDDGCNCFDCSDENHDCSTDSEIKEFSKKTSHQCFKTPKGPHCCSEFDSICHECGDNECEQNCIQFRQEKRCSCDENYIGVSGTNNSRCISKEEKNKTLIYSTENEIGAVNLYTNTSRVLMEKIDATALSSAHNFIYYATFTNSIGRIFKTSTSSNETYEITSSGIDSKIISIAIDWITNQTYYSTNTSKIIVCSKNGDICKEVKSRNALSISLAPRFGLLFWVERKDGAATSQYIMKSGMDGSEEALLTVCEDVPWPLTISVDEMAQTVYFWTSLTRLSNISFSGNIKKINQPNKYSSIGQAFFTVFEKNVYFSYTKSNQIHVTQTSSPISNASLQISYPRSNSINNLYAFNPQLQRTKIPNPCNGSCIGGLCLLRPTSSKYFLNSTCIRDGFEGSSKNSSYEIVIYVFAAVIITIFLVLMMKNLYDRWKKEQLRDGQSVEISVPLESRRNNEPLIDVFDGCSKLNKNVYVKNICKKLDSSATECEKKMLNTN